MSRGLGRSAAHECGGEGGRRTLLRAVGDVAQAGGGVLAGRQAGTQHGGHEAQRRA